MMIDMKKVLLGVTVLCVSLSAFAATPTPATPTTSDSKDKAVALIMKVAQGKMVIKQAFTAIDNLKGFVVTPKSGGQEIIVYADKGGRYMFVGNLIDASGTNISEQDYAKYIEVEMASKALPLAKNTQWFTIGKASAPHQAYMIIEPNCGLCHQLFMQMKPYIDSGQVALRLIVVSFINDSSEGKAAAILQSPDPEKSFIENEAKFTGTGKKESGGITPAKVIKPSTQAALKKNLEYMTNHNFPGTPVLIFKGQNDKPQVIQGLITGKRLENVVNTMGQL